MILSLVPISGTCFPRSPPTLLHLQSSSVPSIREFHSLLNKLALDPYTNIFGQEKSSAHCARSLCCHASQMPENLKMTHSHLWRFVSEIIPFQLLEIFPVPLCNMNHVLIAVAMNKIQAGSLFRKHCKILYLIKIALQLEQKIQFCNVLYIWIPASLQRPLSLTNNPITFQSFYCSHLYSSLLLQWQCRGSASREFLSLRALHSLAWISTWCKETFYSVLASRQDVW